nr:acyl-[acyl-carrier-protein] thioesterase [Treponema sp.]
QKISLTTWEEKPAGLQLSRKYEMKDSQSGELLIKGWSYWTVIDFNKRKIIPPKLFTLRPEPTLTTEYDGVKPGKISLSETMKEIGSHKILFSDMDANGHTNNSKYINFVLDSLPPEYQNKTYKDFKINYSKEAVLNDEISIEADLTGTENKIIVAGKNKGETCFECELYF